MSLCSSVNETLNADNFLIYLDSQFFKGLVMNKGTIQRMLILTSWTILHLGIKNIAFDDFEHWLEMKRLSEVKHRVES